MSLVRPSSYPKPILFLTNTFQVRLELTVSSLRVVGGVVGGLLLALLATALLVLARLPRVREAEHVVLAQDHARPRLQDYRLCHLCNKAQIISYVNRNKEYGVSINQTM